MTTTLADTSAWVSYLRNGREHPWGAELDALLSRGELLICGPVFAELLASTAERDREQLAESLRGLEWAELDRPAWARAGILAARLRAAGETVPLTDVFIAAAALAAGAELLTADSDFERIAGHDPQLRLRLLRDPR